MKQILVISIILGSMISLHAQRGFYETDTLKVLGVKMINSGEIENARVCRVVTKDGTIEFFPGEVTYYGFNKGSSYKSFSIASGDSTTGYFMEEIVRGEIDFYYLREDRKTRRFFIRENDSVDIRELNWKNLEYKESFRDIIGNQIQADLNLDILKPSKYHIYRFVNDLNRGISRPLPRIRYSVFAGVTAVLFSPTGTGTIPEHATNNTEWSPMAGLSVDVPFNSSNLSIHPEVYFKYMGLLLSWEDTNKIYDQFIKNATFSIPVFFRYSFLGNVLSPYVQAGPHYTRSAWSDYERFKYYENETTIYTELDESPAMNKDMAGFSFAGGMIFKYSEKLSLFGELRFSQSYNLGKDSGELRYGEINMVTGIMF